VIIRRRQIWYIKKLGNGTGARFRVRRPFDPRSGLPEAETTGEELVTWYQHAPVDCIQWTTHAVAASVDRRVVVSAAQARSLLAAVRALSERGQHLEAFFARLYYAALRPSEAGMLRESDLYLPKKGWGRIVLAASASRAGTAWTDDGTARQERGLKHRADNDTRTIPIPPTARQVLAALRDEGLIITTPGWGSFVAGNQDKQT
jgi:integrase